MSLWQVATETKPVAQKTHRCDWCNQKIEPGEEYFRCDGIYDGESATLKMHSECREAELREVEQQDKYYKWEPNYHMGSYDRGKTLDEMQQAKQT